MSTDGYDNWGEENNLNNDEEIRMTSVSPDLACVRSCDGRSRSQERDSGLPCPVPPSKVQKPGWQNVTGESGMHESGLMFIQYKGGLRLHHPGNPASLNGDWWLVCQHANKCFWSPVDKIYKMIYFHENNNESRSHIRSKNAKVTDGTILYTGFKIISRRLPSPHLTLTLEHEPPENLNCVWSVQSHS